MKWPDLLAPLHSTGYPMKELSCDIAINTAQILVTSMIVFLFATTRSNAETFLSHVGRDGEDLTYIIDALSVILRIIIVVVPVIIAFVFKDHFFTEFADLWEPPASP
ncbi:hypothetical protein F444_18558 [Phytophthora nicotianae P1976]|uniref:Uncharacterized protein n=1 Tax=Phytophthora nicotianae P1976 TaxID=1317066 RepID=A0A080ZAZ7_PHYNI|nr:hypothetical protein F444_18558 [Phytophthora nicotianae P1976]